MKFPIFSQQRSAAPWLLLVMCLFSSCGWAQLTLTVQPELLDQKTAQLQQLSHALSRAMGSEVELIAPRSWSDFQAGLLNNAYDIVLAEPHIIAWATRAPSMGGLGHEVLAEADAQLRYHVAVYQDSDLHGRDSLRGRQVCVVGQASLAKLSVMAELDNPILAPTMRSVANEAAALGDLQRGRCAAVVLEERRYFALQAARHNLRSVYISEAFPAWAFSISQTQSADLKQRLAAALSQTRHASAQMLIKDIFTDLKAFKPVQNIAQYEHLNLLPGLVYGW